VEQRALVTVKDAICATKNPGEILALQTRPVLGTQTKTTSLVDITNMHLPKNKRPNQKDLITKRLHRMSKRVGPMLRSMSQRLSLNGMEAHYWRALWPKADFVVIMFNRVSKQQRGS